MTVDSPLVIVLYGAVAADAPPDEQDVFDEVRAVTESLERLGYRVERLALTLDLETARQELARRRPQLVFNLVESVAGSGRLIGLAPALLEELGFPYTGTPLDGLLLSSNKLVAKQWLAANGLATPPWWSPDDGAANIPRPGPWIVKSVWEHASIGLEDDSLLSDATALADAIAQRHRRLGGEWYAETYIDGREFNLSLIASTDGLEVLPVAEIRFDDFPPVKPRIVGYAAKWEENSFEYLHTRRSFAFAASDSLLLERLRELALRCVSLLQVRGYARVDFRVDQANKPWVLEVNANPCLSADAGFVAAAAQAGLDVDGVIGRIVADALRDTAFPLSARS